MDRTPIVVRLSIIADAVSAPQLMQELSAEAFEASFLRGISRSISMHTPSGPISVTLTV